MALFAADALFHALVEAGIVPDVDTVRRVVIDLQAGHIPIVHVESYADEKVLHVVRALDGVEIRRE